MVNNFFLDSLAPSYCVLCQRPSKRPIPLCERCEKELPGNNCACQTCAIPLTAPGLNCISCQRHPPNFRRCLAPWLYRQPISHFLQRFKFSADMSLLPLLTQLLVEPVEQAIEEFGVPDALVPVPMHWWRHWQRGFNQAELLADALLKHRRIKPIGLKLNRHLCQKTKLTAAQHNLDLAQRRHNLKSAFHCKADLRGQYLVIVDDVMTSGATAQELSQVLLQAGAQRVDIWCLARTPGPTP
jgi:ComF family protein